MSWTIHTFSNLETSVSCRTSVRCFAQVQVDVSCSSFIHQRSNPVVEGHQICQAQFALSEAMLVVTSLFSMWRSMVSRRINSMILPGTVVRLTGLQFPASSFFPFLKMRVMFPLFQSVGTSLDYHDFSNRMDSGLATSSTSSLGTRRCIYQVPWTCAPSGSLDGLEPDLLLWWVVLHSPSPCLCLL